MRTPEQKLTALLGYAPAKDDLDAIDRACRELDIDEQDVLLDLILALHYHLLLMREIPKEIDRVAKAAVQRITAELDASVNKFRWTAAESGRSLQRANAKWLRATLFADRALLAGLAGVFFVGALVAAIVTVGVVRHADGDWGDAAHTWAESPDGYRAFQMAEQGYLQLLMSCTGPGLVRVQDRCVPAGSEGQAGAGWPIQQ